MNESIQKVDQASKFVAAVVLAFAGDPFVRWMLPEPQQFLTYFSRLTQLHAERTSANGGAFALTGGQGAAFWYPPNIYPDGEALGQVFGEAGIRERVGAVWEQSAAFEPEGPHWYLRLIGVDPAAQGSGLGRLLLEAGLAEVDARGDAAYLEATSEAGRRFYERFGFSTLGVVQVGSFAPLWPMLRAPR